MGAGNLKPREKKRGKVQKKSPGQKQLWKSEVQNISLPAGRLWEMLGTISGGGGGGADQKIRLAMAILVGKGRKENWIGGSRTLWTKNKKNLSLRELN